MQLQIMQNFYTIGKIFVNKDFYYLQMQMMFSSNIIDLAKTLHGK